MSTFSIFVRFVSCTEVPSSRARSFLVEQEPRRSIANVEKSTRVEQVGRPADWSRFSSIRSSRCACATVSDVLLNAICILWYVGFVGRNLSNCHESCTNSNRRRQSCYRGKCKRNEKREKKDISLIGTSPNLSLRYTLLCVTLTFVPKFEKISYRRHVSMEFRSLDAHERTPIGSEREVNWKREMRALRDGSGNAKDTRRKSLRIVWSKLFWLTYETPRRVIGGRSCKIKWKKVLRM